LLYPSITDIVPWTWRITVIERRMPAKAAIELSVRLLRHRFEEHAHQVSMYGRSQVWAATARACVIS